jgi:hypothetical protein
MDSLRVVTFNTRLRSWSMEAIDRKDPFFAEDAEKRARAIAKRILSSPFDYDIVALNEVFDEDAREILSKELDSKYPHQVVKADVNNVGSQVFGAVLMLPTSIMLAAYGLSILVNTKFEDSGLMLFSRFPFDRIPKPSETGSNVPDTVPNVHFLPYTLTEHDEGLASKGAVLARLLVDGRRCDVIISHTQATYPTDDDYAEIRTSQFREVQQLIKAVIGLPLPPDNELLFMGDLNIEGTFPPAAAGKPGDEWTTRFNTLGDFYTDAIHDLWVHEQSPGLPLPSNPDQVWDLGPTTVGGERLDYIVHQPPRGDRLTTQHLSIAYELTTNNPAIDGDVVAYTSDHYALRADLTLDHPHRSAATALAATANPLFTRNSSLRPGFMEWYRFDQPGTYAFKVTDRNGNPPSFEVFLASDLSNPMASYRLEEVFERGLKFILPEAPFFVRVFFDDRHAAGGYIFRAERMIGSSRREAIQLLPNVSQAHTTSSGVALNQDDPNTEWNEADSVWFCADTSRVDSGRDQDLVFRLRHGYGEPIFNLILLQETDGTLKQVGETGPVRDVGEVRWATSARERFFVLVKRDDPRYPLGHPDKFSATDFEVEWTTNLTILYGLKGGRPGEELRLFCSDETDGFLGSEAGADDIKVELTTDGSITQKIDNHEIGDFDQADTRSLEPWLGVVSYIDGFKVELVEMDDLSADDRASVTIPNISRVESMTGVFHPTRPKQADGTLHGWFLIDFGDGKYRFHCSLAGWLPI